MMENLAVINCVVLT